MARLKDEYMEEIEEFYKEKVEPLESRLDIPSTEGDSHKDEPYFGDNEPAF